MNGQGERTGVRSERVRKRRVRQGTEYRAEQPNLRLICVLVCILFNSV